MEILNQDISLLHGLIAVAAALSTNFLRPLLNAATNKKVADGEKENAVTKATNQHLLDEVKRLKSELDEHKTEIKNKEKREDQLAGQLSECKEGRGKAEGELQATRRFLEDQFK